MAEIPIFPEGSLSESVVTTVWVAIFVVCMLNLRLGWTFSGLVVPGYLVPLLIAKPWGAVVIMLEAILTYSIVWWASEMCSKLGVWSSLFGRDRFFAFVLCSVVVRIALDGYLLPYIGRIVTEESSFNSIPSIPYTSHRCKRTSGPPPWSSPTGHRFRPRRSAGGRDSSSRSNRAR